MATEHTKVIEISDAISQDCFYAECEHYDDLDRPLDENGNIAEFCTCPTFTAKVCVACMEAAGYGDDPEQWADWEVGLIEWPCKHAPAVQGPEPEPAILKPAAHPGGETNG